MVLSLTSIDNYQLSSIVPDLYLIIQVFDDYQFIHSRMGFSLTKTIQLLGYPYLWKPPYVIIQVI